MEGTGVRLKRVSEKKSGKRERERERQENRKKEKKKLFFLSRLLFLGPILVMRIDQWGREFEIEL